MSAIRDIRLLVARHLDLPLNAKAAIIDVLNILDTSLDAEGYENPHELNAALRRLDHIIVFGEDIEEQASNDALDEDDLVDINDIFFDDDDDDDED